VQFTIKVAFGTFPESSSYAAESKGCANEKILIILRPNPSSTRPSRYLQGGSANIFLNANIKA